MLVLKCPLFKGSYCIENFILLTIMFVLQGIPNAMPTPWNGDGAKSITVTDDRKNVLNSLHLKTITLLSSSFTRLSF